MIDSRTPSDTSDAHLDDGGLIAIRPKEVKVLVNSVAALLLLLALPLSGSAQEGQEPPKKKQEKDLTELSLEDLMKVDITSVSKREQSLMDAPAAVTVIRGEDIRRTGATSIPEALRLVPGLFVAHVDANKWIVGSRGFGDVFSNKLLVLIDGRSVYSPLFSGVFWTAQDVALEDVDRIEVIRGPGATVWGANAVNGVINIITKKAKDTQGGLVTVGGGSAERAFTTVRYGGKIDEDLSYRIYVKSFLRDSLPGANDDWYSARGGFRFDYTPRPEDLFTFQGDYYHTVARETQMIFFPTPTAAVAQMLIDPTRYSGVNLIGRWERDLGSESRLRAQAYYDHTSYNSPVIQETRDTFDIDLQHQFPLFGGQTITWGLGYRWSGNNAVNSPTVALIPNHRGLSTTSAFFQDEIALADTLTLTLGSKFEYNSFTGFEIEPGARLSWRPLENHTLWISAARAVRTPSQADENVSVYQALLPAAPPFQPFPTLLRVNGTNTFDSEDLFALELGYRVRPVDTVTVDLTAYRNNYNHLRTTEFGATDITTIPFYVTQNLNLANMMKGITWGIELAAAWQALEGVRFQGGYTYMRMLLFLDPGSTDPGSINAQNNDPHHMGFLRASVDLVKDVQLDLIGRAVGSLVNRNVAGYADMDVRIGWHILPNLEASLVGQNLIHPHFESANTAFGDQATQAPRGVYASLNWRF
jgi:iron complex outermembrane receptor protein